MPLTLTLTAAYPGVHCCSFGTPASMLDKASAEFFASMLTSVVYQNDIVCRLSYKNLSKLRFEILTALTRVKASKVEILQYAVKKLPPASTLMYDVDEIPDSAFKRMIDQYKAQVSRREQICYNAETELCMPGKVVHIYKMPKSSDTYSQLSSNGGLFNIFVAEQVFVAEERPLTDFQSIKLSPTMFADHLPDNYMDSLKYLSKAAFEVAASTGYELS